MPAALYQYGGTVPLQPFGTLRRNDERKHKILITLLAVAVTVSLTTVPAFALTESEVQDQVNAVGKEVVTGNLFVWFLCAIAF